jgi:uncharacterized UPF0160 family protein
MTTTRTANTTIRAITHSGDFHPDDVMSGALLREVFPGITITRTRDPQVLAAALADDTFVFDVGGEHRVTGRNFDHHQREGAPAPRENGVGFSSFGLLWYSSYGMFFCDKLIQSFGLEGAVSVSRLHELIDIELVQGIDILDAGQIKDPNFRPLVGEVAVEMATFGLALFRLAPQPLLFGEPDYNGAYEEAVAMAQKFLRRFAEACLAKLYGRKLICEGRLVEERIVVVHKTIPDWSDVVSVEFPETLYYLDPDTSDPTGQAYMVWQVPTAPRAFSGRKPLPEAWAGKRGDELKAVTGITGANFCHGARFVCGGETLAAAVAMAWKAIRAE